jgi:hypothetical protein
MVVLKEDITFGFCKFDGNGERIMKWFSYWRLWRISLLVIVFPFNQSSCTAASYEIKNANGTFIKN